MLKIYAGYYYKYLFDQKNHRFFAVIKDLIYNLFQIFLFYK